MKIYAIRDRLIDYFMQPFVGPDNKSVLASVAKLVNQEGTSDIAQAPHHFEVWELGEVNAEDGHITPKLDFIADCSSLVRRGIRETRLPEDGQTEAATEGRTRSPGGAGLGTRADNRAPPNAPPGAPGEASEVLRGPRGGYQPRGDD